MEGIAQLLAQGKNVHNIARETNLDIATVDGILSRDEFHTVFRDLDPSAYQRWQDDQADLTAKRAVKNMARADAVEHYKLYRDMVKAPDTELKPHERLSHLWNLIKAGGVLDGQDVAPPTVLSEGTMEVMSETLTELGEFFGRTKGK